MVLTDEEGKLFMRSKEIAERLLAGEDPLELAIEAWEKKKEAIRKVQDTNDIPITEMDCPLCHVYMDNGCEGCPLEEAGEGCLPDDSTESPYHLAVVAFRENLCDNWGRTQEELLQCKEKAAQHMIDTLKKVRGGEE